MDVNVKERSGTRCATDGQTEQSIDILYETAYIYFFFFEFITWFWTKKNNERERKPIKIYDHLNVDR